MALSQGNKALASDFNNAHTALARILSREGKSQTASTISTGTTMGTANMNKLLNDYRTARDNYTTGCDAHCPSNRSSHKGGYRSHTGCTNNSKYGTHKVSYWGMHRNTGGTGSTNGS